jgi:hemolysin activation/secretion protein
LFSIAGSGTIAGIRYNQHLNKLGNYEHKLVYSLDYKAFQSRVISASGASLVPDITVHPAGLTYQGTYRQERSETSFYAGVSQNIFPGDNDGADSDFKASRADAKASYRVYRVGLSHTRATETDWQARLQLSGQYTEHALITGEQFGVGGAENVRGFIEREIANDRGYRGIVELFTPNIGSKINLPNTQTRLLVFYDWGEVSRVSPQPGEALGQSIASVGAGLRIAGSKYWSSRFDYARVIDAGGSQNKGHTRLHMSLNLSY